MNEHFAPIWWKTRESRFENHNSNDSKVRPELLYSVLYKTYSCLHEGQMFLGLVVANEYSIVPEKKGLDYFHFYYKFTNIC